MRTVTRCCFKFFVHSRFAEICHELRQSCESLIIIIICRIDIKCSWVRTFSNYLFSHLLCSQEKQEEEVVQASEGRILVTKLSMTTSGPCTASMCIDS